MFRFRNLILASLLVFPWACSSVDEYQTFHILDEESEVVATYQIIDYSYNYSDNTVIITTSKGEKITVKDGYEIY